MAVDWICFEGMGAVEKGVCLPGNCLRHSIQCTAFYGRICSPSLPPPPTPSRCRQCPAVHGRDSVWGCRWSYQNATLHHEEGVWCIICTEAFPTSSSGAWGPMQRVHGRGSEVMSECCTVGHSTTLARAHAHMITGTISMLYSRVLSHLGQSPCAQFHLLREQGSSFTGGAMQRFHRRGSQVLSECCKVGYSATSARAQIHLLREQT